MEKIKAIKRSGGANLGDTNEKYYEDDIILDDKSKRDKLTKNHSSKNKIENSQKNKKSKHNNQKVRKNTAFLRFFKQNYIDFLIIGICFVICFVLDIVIFLNNDYYNFLNRPKPISSSIVILVLLMLLILLNLFFNVIWSKFFLKTHDDFSQKNRSVNSHKDCENLENIKVHDITHKSKFFKLFQNLFCKRPQIEKYLSFIFVACILLSFMAKCLWLCAFFSFCVFFNSVLVLIKNYKSKYPTKIICMLMVLVSICVLLAFYLLFMLN